MKIAANKNKIIMISDCFQMGMLEMPFPNETDWSSREWNRLNKERQQFVHWNRNSIDFCDVDQSCTILLSSCANEDIRVIHVNTEGSKVNFRIRRKNEGWEHLNKLMAKVSSLVENIDGKKPELDQLQH